MKKIKPIIASTLMAFSIVSMPLVSFADSDHSNKGNDNHGKQVSAQVGARLAINDDRNDDNHKSNSIWNRFSNLLGKKQASAQVASSISRPTISGITAPTVLKAGETGTWTVNASDSQNSALTYSVNWGDNGSNPLARMFNSTEEVFTQTSTFTHEYANSGTYTVKFTVKNSSGKETTTSTNVHVTGSSINAPVISNVVAQASSSRKATISWTTNIRASSSIWYSKTSPVNTSGRANISNNGKILDHKINLNRLEPNTKYYVVVASGNGANRTFSSEISFTTPSTNNDNQTPVITSVSGNTSIVAGDTETVTVNAYDPKNGALTYSADWGDSTSIMSTSRLASPVYVQTSTFSHVYDNPGIYTATFTAQNSAGLKASSSITITVTKNPTDSVLPLISNIGITVGASASTITWTTDEPSNSKIYYSTVSPIDMNTNASISDGSLVTSHSLTIPNLTASTLHHFKIASADGSNNVGTSSEMTFTTTF